METPTVTDADLVRKLDGDLRAVEDYRLCLRGPYGLTTDRAEALAAFAGLALDFWPAACRRVLAAEADRAELLEACERAAQFIRNGIDFGYIAMPEPGDTANDTLPMLAALVARIKGDAHAR